MELARERRRIQGCNFGGAEDDDKDDANKHRRFDLADSSSSSSSWPAPAAAGAQADSGAVPEKEHMFDKVVTPSDVGKLNRLVIPKQHAEKHFPLDTAAHEKGLLLSFEDRGGKPWRFRYSYWNSSQSYVITKGWSRFVKEKRLDAGDTVSFCRGVDDRDRLFIDWKRRPEIRDPPRLPRIPTSYHRHHHPMLSFGRPVGPLAGRLLVPKQAAAAVYDVSGGGGSPYLVFRSAVGPPQGALQSGSGFSFMGGGLDGALAGAASPMVLESVSVVQRQAAAKRVRLFGVNLDWAPEPNGDPDKDQPPSLDLDM